MTKGKFSLKARDWTPELYFYWHKMSIFFLYIFEYENSPGRVARGKVLWTNCCNCLFIFRRRSIILFHEVSSREAERSALSGVSAWTVPQWFSPDTQPSQAQEQPQTLLVLPINWLGSQKKNLFPTLDCFSRYLSINRWMKGCPEPIRPL